MNSQPLHFSRNPVVFWFVSLPMAMWQITVGETLRLYHVFSIPELFRTLFAPWKRDEYSTEGLALSDKFHVWTGNIAGRFVAFIIRSITIFVGFICTGGFFLLGVGLIIGQMLLPLWIVLILALGAHLI